MSKFIEYVNEDICDKLSKMTYPQFCLLFSKSSSKRHNDYNLKAEYKKIINYCKFQIENSYKAEIKYYQKGEDKNIGRCIAEGDCMQRLYNGFRGVLMNGITYDIDMKNAHPTILYNLCRQFDIKATALYKYINEREEIFDNILKTDNISRGECKNNLFLRALNKSELTTHYNKKKIKNKFFIEFDTEIKLIQKELITKFDNDTIAKYEKCIKEDKEYNRIGSLLNIILCDYENEILQKALNFIKNETIYKVNVLMFDGFMIEIPKDSDINIKELLTELNKVTKDDFIKWDYKPHNIELLEHMDKMTFVDKTDELYEKIKEDFEKTHFKTMRPVQFIEILKDKSLYIRDSKDLYKAYENKYFNEEKFIEAKEDKNGNIIQEEKIEYIETQFISNWVKDRDMRQYDKIDFLPQQTAPDNVFNTFSGYSGAELPKLEPEINEEDKIIIENTAIYKHIKNVCNNDPDVVDYVIKFMARKLQKPYLLHRIALLFKSIQGAGKDTLFDWFGKKIIGKDYFYSGAFKEIYHQFNRKYLFNKTLVVITELSSQDSFNRDEDIKQSITRPEIKIEEKGKEAFLITNNIGYVYFTNNENPLKIDINDRRFCAIQCNDTIANDNDYFNALYKEMDNQKINRAFYDYFMSVEISDDYNFVVNRPITDYYKSCQSRNIPIIANFFEEQLMKYHDKDIVSYAKFYECFSDYLKQKGHKYDYSETRFGIDIKSYLGITKKHTKKGRVYDINIQELKNYLISKKYIEDTVIDDVSEVLFVDEDTIEEKGKKSYRS
jgi:hypothetical protein